MRRPKWLEIGFRGREVCLRAEHISSFFLFTEAHEDAEEDAEEVTRVVMASGDAVEVAGDWTQAIKKAVGIP